MRADGRPTRTPDVEAAADLDVGAPFPLTDAGPGYAALGSSSYADEDWLWVTGQDVHVDKSCSWVQGERVAPVLLRGAPIPPTDTFRQLGVDVAIRGSRTTGPVLSQRLEAVRAALRRLPNLPTYDRREQAISTLVTPLALHGVAVASALHGVAVASVTDPDLRGLETAVVWALWGATRLSRAKEIVFSVLSKGHRVSPVMHTRYERLLWLARVARRPGVTQFFTRAIWELGGRPPGCAWWGARSKRRPPRGGAPARAGGAGTSPGRSARCTLCRSPSARSSTGYGTTSAATPRANWRRGAQSASRALVTGLVARSATRQCASLEQS